MEKIEIKASSIPDSGKGLFALKNFKKGQIILQFTGKLHKMGEHCNNGRSNIYFNDGFYLQCYSNDKASFANDPIKFELKRRKLMESLKSPDPLYKCHQNAKVNAEIKINDNLHKAFLLASTDIDIGEEIFCHYGFNYWFTKELCLGFLGEDEIEKNGFPENIFKYPAFANYLKEFYPSHKNYTIDQFNENEFIITIFFDNDMIINMPLPNYKKKIIKATI